MPIVDFFVAGVQKGGTTALSSLLGRHPEIRLPPGKELHFFDDERLDWAAPDYTKLHRAFDWYDPAVRVRGEATPVYTYWRPALARIRRYNPAARFIVGLRHPALRAFSHWRMETRRGAETLPFAEAVTRAGRSRLGSEPHRLHRVYSYVERGFYAPQLERLLALFPRRQLHVFRTDALWQDQAGTLGAIERFLGVAPGPGAGPGRDYVVRVDSTGLGEIPPDVRRALTEVFRKDIGETARLTGLDLSDWLREAYREPMRSADAGRRDGQAGGREPAPRAAIARQSLATNMSS